MISLTPKGERTRTRIVDAAARLIYAHGVADATLEDVKSAAGVSGSQLYHYFADKQSLVQAVIEKQTGAIIETHDRLDLGTLQGLRAWRDLVVSQAASSYGEGGCPLGSLGTQLAETDPRARAQIAAGFDRWSSTLGRGLRTLHDKGHLAPGINPDDLAATVLATLQGGLLLAQVQRDVHPLAIALDTLLAVAVVP